MSLVLDLRDVSGGDRSQRWQRTIRDNYLDLDIRFTSDPTPSGLIAQSRIGAMTFGAIASVPQTHERTLARMSDEVDHLIAWMQFRGHARLIQRGRDVDIAPGRFLVMDAGDAYRAEFLDEYQIFAIKIPRLFFHGAFATKREFINVCVEEEHGSMIIVDYFRRMAQHFDHLALEQKAAMGAHGIRMMMDTLTAHV